MLDGNAAGGILSEVFAADVTAALCTCNSCGGVAPVAAAHAYMDGPGTVLRCSSCGAALVRSRARARFCPARLAAKNARNASASSSTRSNSSRRSRSASTCSPVKTSGSLRW